MGIHTGEDWNGVGGGNTDLGQPVYSIGKGVVVQADNYYSPWGNIVLIDHKFLENGNFRTVLSLYAHLDTIYISKGDTVNRRDSIGTIGTGGSSYPAHLHFEIRKDSLADYPADYWPSSAGKDINWVFENYEDPSKFLNSHRVLTSPGKEDKIIIAIKHEYRMYLYFDSVLQKKYEIALSQNPYGHKEKQGDNRLPEGEYLIIEKALA